MFRPPGQARRRRPLDLDHQGRGQPGQRLVELRDRAPVDRVLQFQRGDRRLQLVRPGAGGPAQCGQPLDGPAAVPAGAVLLGQRDVPAGVGAGAPAGVVQQHQRQQGVHLGLGRQQLGQQPAQPDGLVAEAGPDELVAGGGRVPLGEDQVDHLQHRVQAGRQLGVRRHPVGDAGQRDLPLGPGQPLGHGRLRDQERAGDLGRVQAAQGAQGERDPGGRVQGRVTAGEDQPEPVVGDRGVRARGRVLLLGQPGGVGQPGGPVGLGPVAAQPVDGLAPGRGGQPGARVVGDAVARPGRDRGHEGVLGRLLGQLHVAHPPDERGQDRRPLVPEGPLDRVVHSVTTGRTSTEP